MTERTLHRIGFWASACCAVHCALTPVLLIFFPLMIQMPERWHDTFIYATLALGLGLTGWSSYKHHTYKPLLLVVAACGMAIYSQFLYSCTAPDITIGILLSLAHWFNHKVKYCKHLH